MGTELSPMQGFTERLKDSLRDDVARMIPDEVLKQLIETVLREEFFTGKVEKDSYGHVRGVKPPAFHSLIVDALMPTLNEEAAKVALRMAHEFDKRLHEQFERGITQVVMQHVDKAFFGALEQMSSDWRFQEFVRNALKNAGILK